MNKSIVAAKIASVVAEAELEEGTLIQAEVVSTGLHIDVFGPDERDRDDAEDIEEEEDDGGDEENDAPEEEKDGLKLISQAAESVEPTTTWMLS